MHLLELVPRDLDELDRDVSLIREAFPSVSGFNIPDILRMNHRSYEAVERLLKCGAFAIPHIRTIDLPLDASVTLISSLVDAGLSSVLLVSGDVPTAIQPTYSVSPIQLTRSLKTAFPELNVYCALDPYRQSISAEIDYAYKKLDAGADGFFTQPFFDVQLASVYLDFLKDTSVFLGVSPVLTEASYNYWVTKNKVIFPSNFESTMPYHVTLARGIIDLADTSDQHTYHMPIRLSGFEYVKSVFLDTL